MNMRIITTTTAPPAKGPYSPAIEVDGFLFCSGQVSLDPETGEFFDGDIVAQTTRILKNLSNLLIAGGSGLNHVIKTTVYLADINDFQTMNEVYGKAFGNHFPARTTIQVAALPLGAKIEIEAIARVVR
jgi:2-iminobutanoate/2-iminopropanoate deaminase